MIRDYNECLHRLLFSTEMISAKSDFTYTFMCEIFADIFAEIFADIFAEMAEHIHRHFSKNLAIRVCAKRFFAFNF